MAEEVILPYTNRAMRRVAEERKEGDASHLGVLQMAIRPSLRHQRIARSATSTSMTSGYARGILASGLIAAMFTVPVAEASVLVDNSPVALGSKPSQFSANDSQGSNFLVQVTLKNASYIDGFSIFTLHTTPSDVTMKLRADDGGIPAASNLLTFTDTATFDHVDTGSQDVYRATASFSPINLAAGTYWIGMSQTAIQRGNDPELGWLQYQPTSATDQGQYNLRGNSISNPVQGLPFQIDGGMIVSSVPLPASAPMFGAALLAFGVVGYGAKRGRSNATTA